MISGQIRKSTGTKHDSCLVHAYLVIPKILSASNTKINTDVKPLFNSRPHYVLNCVFSRSPIAHPWNFRVRFCRPGVNGSHIFNTLGLGALPQALSLIHVRAHSDANPPLTVIRSKFPHRGNVSQFDCVLTGLPNHTRLASTESIVFLGIPIRKSNRGQNR
jgi:hypothetical protein